MKHSILNTQRIAFLALALLLSLTAMAQSGLKDLNCHRLFDTKMPGVRILTETHVEGSRVAKYNLKVFRSIQCSVTEQALVTTEMLLRADEAKASSKELVRKDDDTQFAILSYKQPRNMKHYLIFKKKSNSEFTLVYMEGTATIEQLKKIFYK